MKVSQGTHYITQSIRMILIIVIGSDDVSCGCKWCSCDVEKTEDSHHIFDDDDESVVFKMSLPAAQRLLPKSNESSSHNIDWLKLMIQAISISSTSLSKYDFEVPTTECAMDHSTEDYKQSLDYFTVENACPCPCHFRKSNPIDIPRKKDNWEFLNSWLAKP